MGRLGWRAMAHTLTQNSTLREIHVRDTGCDSNLLTNFVTEVAGKNTTLELLDVSDNKIDDFEKKLKPKLEQEVVFSIKFEKEEKKKK